MKEKILSKEKNMLIPILIGIAVYAALFFVFLFIFSAILANYSLNESVVLVFALVAQGLSALFGGFVCAKLYGKSGLLVGCALGGILFVIFTVLSIILDSGGLTVITIIRLILFMLCSSLGGILGVNLKRKKKII